jgi:hypothetical protein
VQAGWLVQAGWVGGWRLAGAPVALAWWRAVTWAVAVALPSSAPQLPQPPQPPKRHWRRGALAVAGARWQRCALALAPTAERRQGPHPSSPCPPHPHPPTHPTPCSGVAVRHAARGHQAHPRPGPLRPGQAGVHQGNGHAHLLGHPGAQVGARGAAGRRGRAGRAGGAGGAGRGRLLHRPQRLRRCRGLATSRQLLCARGPQRPGGPACWCRPPWCGPDPGPPLPPTPPAARVGMFSCEVCSSEAYVTNENGRLDEPEKCAARPGPPAAAAGAAALRWAGLGGSACSRCIGLAPHPHAAAAPVGAAGLACLCPSPAESLEAGAEPPFPPSSPKLALQVRTLRQQVHAAHGAQPLHLPQQAARQDAGAAGQHPGGRDAARRAHVRVRAVRGPGAPRRPRHNHRCAPAALAPAASGLVHWPGKHWPGRHVGSHPSSPSHPPPPTPPRPEPLAPPGVAEARGGGAR